MGVMDQMRAEADPEYALKLAEDSPVDSGITAGLKWLAGVVEEDFEDLDARAERDIVQQKVLIAREPPPRERDRDASPWALTSEPPPG